MTASSNIRLSAQRALLGHVSPALRAVCVKAEKSKIHIHFYYDGEISSSDRDSAEETMGEIMGDFWSDEEGNKVEFDYEILRVDYPKKMTLIGDWVYFRREESF